MLCENYGQIQPGEQIKNNVVCNIIRRKEDFFNFFLYICEEQFFSVEEIYETGNVDAKLILHLYKVDLRSRFMEIISNIQKLLQKHIAQQLG